MPVQEKTESFAEIRAALRRAREKASADDPFAAARAALAGGPPRSAKAQQYRHELTAQPLRAIGGIAATAVVDEPFDVIQEREQVLRSIPLSIQRKLMRGAVLDPAERSFVDAFEAVGEAPGEKAARIESVTEFLPKRFAAPSARETGLYGEEEVREAEDAFLPKLAGATAQGLVYVAGMAITGGGMTTMAMLGAASEAPQGYVDTLRELQPRIESGEMTEEEAGTRAAVGAALRGIGGLSEGVGIGRIGGRIRKALTAPAGKKFYKRLGTAIAKESTEEGVQEAFQTQWAAFVSETLTEKQADLWGRFMETVPQMLENAALGAGAGGILSGAGTTAVEPFRRAAAQEEAAPRQPAPLPAEARERLQGALETEEDPGRRQVLEALLQGERPVMEAAPGAETIGPMQPAERASDEEVDKELERVGKVLGIELETTDVESDPDMLLERNFGEQRSAGRVVHAQRRDGQPFGEHPAMYLREGSIIVLDAKAGPAERRRAYLIHEVLHATKVSTGENWETLYQVLEAIDPEGLKTQLKIAQETIEGSSPEVREATLAEGMRKFGDESQAMEDLVRDEAVSQYIQAMSGWMDAMMSDRARFEAVLRGTSDLASRRLLERLYDALVKALRRVGIKLPTSLERRTAEVHRILASTPFEQRLTGGQARAIAETTAALLDASRGSWKLAARQPSERPQLEEAKTAAEKALKRLDDLELETAKQALPDSGETGGESGRMGPEGVARVPTEEGLFGEQERPPAARKEAPPVKATQPKLLDVEEGDLPGQQTIEGAAERLEAFNRDVSAKAKRVADETKRAAQAGEKGLRALVRAEGGLKWTADLAPLSVREGGPRGLVHAKGAPRGRSLDHMIERAQEAGLFPEGVSEAEFLDALAEEPTKAKEPKAAPRRGGGAVDIAEAQDRAEDEAGLKPGDIPFYDPETGEARFATARKAQDVELSRKTLEELQGLAERQEARIEKRERAILGDRYDEFQKLARRNKDEPLLDQLKLSKRDRDFLEGLLGEDYFNELSIKEFQRAREAVQGAAKDEASLGVALGRAISDFVGAAGKDPAAMSFGELRAFAQFDEARIIAEDRDLDLDLIESNAKKTAIGRFVGEGIERADIEFFFKGLREFGKKELEAPQRLALPPGEARFATAPATDTAAFKKWFGDSKVVDENGDPLVSFHGTTESFAVFDTARTNEEGGLFWLGDLGSWFAAPSTSVNYDAENAEFVAAMHAGEDSYTEQYDEGGKILPVYLSIQNPRVYDGGETYMDILNDADRAGGGAAFKERLMAEGHDGIVLRESDTDGGVSRDDWVAFKPTQIKSAIGNVGTFAPGVADIRFATDTTAPTSGFGTQGMPQRRLVDRQIENWVDQQHEILRTQREVAKAGGVLDESTDAYLENELRRGQTKEDIDRIVRGRFFVPILRGLIKAGIKMEDWDLYLYARHAGERNAYIEELRPGEFDAEATPGSGMRTSEAERHVARLEKAHPELAALGRRFDRMTRTTRRIWLRHGLVSRSLVRTLEKRYQHYAPLISELTDEERQRLPRIGRGVDIRGKETIRALGRTTLAANQFAQAVGQMEAAIIRGYKNEVGKRLLKFARTNETLLAGLIESIDVAPMKEVVVETVDEQGVRHARVQRVFDFAARHDSRVFGVKVDGEQHYVTFTPEYRHLAEALSNYGAANMGTFFRGMGLVTRWLARMSTQFNPVFPSVNFIRDLLGAAITSTEHGFRFSARVVSGIPRALVIIGVSKLPKGARPHWFGHWTQMYERYKRSGAPIAFMSHNTYQDTMKAIARAAKRHERPTIRGKTMGIIEALGHVISEVNDTIENGARFSAFVAAQGALGMTEKQAASYAKNLTTNFERRGVHGAMLNAAYMFANAAIQGNTRVAQALTHKKTRRLVILGMIAAGMWDMAMRRWLPDDDDGENPYDKVPNYWKRTTLTFMDPQGGSWHLPLPFVYNIAWTAGRMMGSFSDGVATPGEVVGEVSTALLDSMNPLGGAGSVLGEGKTILANAVPTVAQPGTQIAVNRNWYGGQVMPEEYAGTILADSHRFWPDVNPEMRKFAQWMNATGGGTKRRPGPVDISPETMEHYLKFFTGGVGATIYRTGTVISKTIRGEPVEVREMPLLRRFRRERSRTAAPGKFSEHLGEIRLIRRELKDAEEAGNDAAVARIHEANPALLDAAFYRHTLDTHTVLKRLRTEAEGLSGQARIDKELERDKVANDYNVLWFQEIERK